MSYRLSFSANLDDDGCLVYKGKRYCFYGYDLHFIELFKTAEEAYNYLRTEITEEAGHKLPVGWMKAIIEDFIDCHKRNSSFSGNYGNQEIDIELDEVSDDFKVIAENDSAALSERIKELEAENKKLKEEQKKMLDMVAQLSVLAKERRQACEADIKKMRDYICTGCQLRDHETNCESCNFAEKKGNKE